MQRRCTRLGFSQHRSCMNYESCNHGTHHQHHEPIRNSMSAIALCSDCKGPPDNICCNLHLMVFNTLLSPQTPPPPLASLTPRHGLLCPELRMSQKVCPSDLQCLTTCKPQTTPAIDRQPGSVQVEQTCTARTAGAPEMASAT